MVQSSSFYTNKGSFYSGDAEEIIKKNLINKFKNKINLILTSPPFPLNKKKQYGNLQGEKYKKWLSNFAPLFSELLVNDGSIIIELGNAWDDGAPVQSLLPLESLIAFLNNDGNRLYLCQEFICYNPSRLPSPAQWVTINKIRTVDSFTRVWWISKNIFPKADNTKILRPYSNSMKQLLKKKTYNSGLRPSEHRISENGFLKRNKGSISHNLIEMEPIDPLRDPRLPKNVLSYSNTSSNDFFLSKCRENKIKPHPARMPIGLASFFIQFLTEENDLVFDPFGGSNTTGYVAESLKRRWITTEISNDYFEQAVIRMRDPKLKSKIKVVRKK
jgi:DNA modification methylase